ncbi:MAG: hypothetical protein V4596_03890 [Bdellovibrionota bacterium]
MLDLKKKILVLAGAVMALSACADKSGDISILSDSDTFYQSASVNNKIDIMWMVDSSGSMAPYQNNLSDNFETFITDFVTKGYDYNIAVTATDAWKYTQNPSNSWNQSLVRYRDGDIYDGLTGPNNSGIFMINLLTPNIVNNFKKNIKVGINGDGDERGFQSLRESFGATSINGGYNFKRSSAFLAVILVGDEEDSSRKSNGDAYSSTNEYKNAFVSYLDGYTGSTAGNRKYNVSTITVMDINNCPGHHAGASQGNRFMSIATATAGILGSICDTNFSDSLEDIASRIVELSTRFKLSREPLPSSIVVKVNSVEIPQNATNGWVYIADSGSHYVEFRGTATPQQGAAISVDFDPVSLE